MPHLPCRPLTVEEMAFFEEQMDENDGDEATPHVAATFLAARRSEAEVLLVASGDKVWFVRDAGGPLAIAAQAPLSADARVAARHGEDGFFWCFERADGAGESNEPFDSPWDACDAYYAQVSDKEEAPRALTESELDLMFRVIDENAARRARLQEG